MIAYNDEEKWCYNKIEAWVFNPIQISSMKSMKNCVVNLRHKFFSEKGLLLKVPGLLLKFGSFKRWDFQFFCRLIFAQSEPQNKKNIC